MYYEDIAAMYERLYMNNYFLGFASHRDTTLIPKIVVA